MTRIKNKFSELSNKKQKALVPFFVAGDPDIQTTYELVLKLEKCGADIIELGIPYTDPLADGPIIQAAAARALANNITLPDILNLVKRLREVTQVPIVFLLYFNCVLQYGVKRFLADCADAGVDGLVIPDLPYEERQKYNDLFVEHDVDLIPLVTPVSGKRIKNIVKDSSGFIYCVTSTGITGVRDEFKTNFEEFLGEVKNHTDTPSLLGFGISSAEQAKALTDFGEGVIVGSAIVKKMSMKGGKKDMMNSVCEFVSELKQALK